MTVAELLDRIAAAYPGATPEALKTFKPVFAARLRQHEGPALAEAATAVLGAFKPTIRQPFPIPHDFEVQLPARTLRLSHGPRKLDLAARNERLRLLVHTWRERQGRKAARDAPEVLRAMEYLATLQASVASWHDEPRPIVLTHDELRLARHRAISQQRRLEFGPNPPPSPALFFDQVRTIAERWGIATTIEDWTAKTSERVQVGEAA